MSAEQWKTVAVVLGIMLSVGTLWIGAVRLLLPAFRDWVRIHWAETFSKIEEAHSNARAAKDSVEALLEAVRAQGSVLREALETLRVAQLNAEALGAMRSEMRKLTDKVSRVDRHVVQIRGFMEGHGMKVRDTDREDDDDE